MSPPASRTFSCKGAVSVQLLDVCTLYHQQRTRTEVTSPPGLTCTSLNNREREGKKGREEEEKEEEEEEKCTGGLWGRGEFWQSGVFARLAAT